MSSGDIKTNDRLPTPSPSRDTSNDSAESWRNELGGVHFRQAVSETASSIAAGTTGAIAFGLLRASGTYGRALSIPVAMLAGGLTKYGTKDGAEHVLLDEKDRTTSAADLAWGAVDGLAGVTASIADQRASTMFIRSTGRAELGAKLSESTAELVGKQLIDGSAWKGIQHNVVRGLVGGAAGSATWGLAHETTKNWEEIKQNPLLGIADATKGVVTDTAIGSLTGGVFGGATTALFRSPEIAGRAAAAIKGDGKYLKMDEYVINDFHSNLDKLPQLKTKLDERTAASDAAGIPSEFNVAGDALSGHVNFAFTRGGEVENQALARMGLKNLIPGNHEYDAPGGRFIPERYPGVIGPVLRDNPQISLLNANLDLSAYPEYAALTKPYVVHEIPGPHGPEKVATVGLITEEGAVNKIGYNDAAKTAISTVRDLNAQGITNIKLLTHLGLDEDKKLAKALLDENLVVAKISGGHTHDVVASPIWISNKETLAQKLQFWKQTREIPITQAGSSGQYLGENRIVFNPDGSANRWLTQGKLHPMTDVKPDPELKAFIDGQSAEIAQLKSTSYDAMMTEKYSLANARNRETPLGNLIADALLTGTQKRMGTEGPQIAMVHSGGIRSEIPADQNLTRQEISNVFMNAGNAEGEKKELVMVTMSGDNIKQALEYGLREFPLAQTPSIGKRLSEIFSSPSVTKFDEPGNFVQASGMSYSFDLSKQPFQRVSNLQVTLKNGLSTPMSPLENYRVVTRFHPVDKWIKANLFHDGLPLEDAYAKFDAQPVQVSQVELLGEYIQGRKLDPRIDSKVEGRVNNITPVAQDISLRPQTSIVGFSALDGLNAVENSEQKTKR